MTKPWEERWDLDATDRVASGAEVRTPGRYVQFGRQRGPVGEEWFEADDDDVARARLAAAAPDMARMLLRFEWCLAPGSCPACKNLMPYEHKADCELVDVLRKAGVR